MHRLGFGFALFLSFCLCVSAQTPLEKCETIVDSLYPALQAINIKANPDDIQVVLRQTFDLYILLNVTLTAADFRSCVTYKVAAHPKYTIYELIQWLLSIQSAKTRTDFYAEGGAHARMYAFAILGKILKRYTRVPRIDYLVEHLKHLPNLETGIFKNPVLYAGVDVMSKAVKIAEDDNDGNSPKEVLKQPFWDPFQLLEAQVFNFYNQWAGNVVGAPPLDPTQKLTMDKVLHNMFVYIDMILTADDAFTGKDNNAHFVNYFESNLVYTVIDQVANLKDVQKNNLISYPKSNRYATFLRNKYFVVDSDFRVPKIKDIKSYREPLVDDLAKTVLFRTTKQNTRKFE